MSRKPQKPHVRFEFGWKDSAKLLAAWEDAGDGVITMWTMGTTYCVEHMTDGHIGGAVLRRFTADKKPMRIIAALVKHGVLYERGDDRYEFHDFLDHNSSRAEIEEAKAKKVASGRMGGKRSGEVRAASDAEPSAKQEGSTCFDAAEQVEQQPRSEAKHATAAAVVDAGSRLEGGAGGAAPLPDRQATILTELRAHKVLAGVATLELAEILDGRSIANAKPLDLVLQAIRDVAAHLPPGTRPELIQRKVVAYTDNAKPPRTLAPGLQPVSDRWAPQELTVEAAKKLPAAAPDDPRRF